MLPNDGTDDHLGPYLWLSSSMRQQSLPQIVTFLLPSSTTWCTCRNIKDSLNYSASLKANNTTVMLILLPLSLLFKVKETSDRNIRICQA